MIADYCFSWPSHIVANTDKDFVESTAYSICDIRYSFKESVLFIISNVQALNIPYSFTVLTRYSLFIIPLPPPILNVAFPPFSLTEVMWICNFVQKRMVTLVCLAVRCRYHRIDKNNQGDVNIVRTCRSHRFIFNSFGIAQSLSPM